MPTERAIRERIELYERSIRQKSVRVVKLKLDISDAVVDLIIGENTVLRNKRYPYRKFFLSSKLNSFVAV